MGPMFDTAEADHCSALVNRAPPEQLATIAVSFSQTPEQLASEFDELLGELPACFKLVSVGPQARTADPDEPSDGDRPTSLAESRGGVKTVESHGNLTRLGIRISECLDEIAGRDGVTAKTLCFRSLTPMLVQTDAATVLKFLQTLRGHLASHDVVGHFHLNPAPHDEQVIDLLSTAFDGIIEYDGDEVTIKTR